MLADLESLEKRIAGTNLEGRRRRQAGQAAVRVHDARRWSCCAKAAGAQPSWPMRAQIFAMLCLLTSKPVLYVCNVDEALPTRATPFPTVKEFARLRKVAEAVVISAKIESEIATLDDDERASTWKPSNLRSRG
jgi:ribosome-binding ATPase YchF (GTP1/OBG family)